MSKTSILALLGLALTSVSATDYGKFCTNPDFTDCGIAVSLQNHNCVQESGRQSFHFTESDTELFFPVMIAYSDSNCQNELGCNAVGSGGSEYDIDFTKDQAFKFALGAHSFKFEKSCPNGCTGTCPTRKRSRIEAADYNPLISSGNITSSIVARQDGADFKFCDDDACSVNCGKRIEPNSGGCANNEYNRKSALFTGVGKTTTVLGAYDNNQCDGAPVVKVNAKEGCNVLPSQHNSWDVIGISS